MRIFTLLSYFFGDSKFIINILRLISDPQYIPLEKSTRAEEFERITFKFLNAYQIYKLV